MAVYNIGRVAYVNQGAYNPATTYYKYDVVLYQNGSYVYMYTTPAAGNVPTNATYWDVMLDPSAMNTAVGLISYMHMKYSEDNPSADEDMSDDPGDWLGIYIGSSTTAPTSYSDYVWHNITGVHIGNSAPSGSEKLWVDTDANDLMADYQDVLDATDAANTAAANAKSAYVQAVEGGYTGTLEDFYISLNEVENVLSAQTAAEAARDLAEGYAAQLAISVKNYGAVGDGTTDDTDAINAAIAAAEGKTLFFPAGTYVIDTSVSVVLETGIDIIGAPGAVIDGAGSTDVTLLKVSGSVGMPSPLLGDVAFMATAITTNLTLVPGDMIQILSTDVFNGVAGSQKGEIAEVLSVAGTTITLKCPLLDEYTAATTGISKLTMPVVHIENISFIRNSNHGGVTVEYAKDVVVKNCSMKGARERGFQLSYVYGGTFTDNYITDVYYSGTGTSYGLICASCQNINITNNRIVGGRNSVDMGGVVPCRNIKISHNTLCAYIPIAKAAIGIHPATELVDISDNTLFNGVSIQGNKIRVRNNTIYAATYYGVYYVASCIADYIEITGNAIAASTYVAANFPAVYVSATIPNFTIDILEISRNTLYGSGIHMDISNVANTGCIVNDLIMVDNEVLSQSGRSFQILDSASNNTGTKLTVNNLVVTGGRYSCVSVSTWLLYVETIGKLTVNGALISTDQANSSFAIIKGFSHADISNSRLLGVVDVNGGPSTRYADISTVKTIKITDNHIENFLLYRGLYLTSELCIARDNLFTNCAGSVSITGKGIENVGMNNQYTTRSSAVPAAGTWTAGDRAINSAPTIGQPKAWVCTGSGTQGTLNGGGTTGSIESGSAILTVNSATGLHINCVISIAGVTGSKRVKIIDGLTITLTATSNATVTDAAVAFVNGTWVSEGNL